MRARSKWSADAEVDGKLRQPGKAPRMPLWQQIAFILFLVAVASAGSWLIVEQGRSVRRGVEDDLLSICRLKVNQIAVWRTERLRDAASIGGNLPFARAVADWQATGDDTDEQAILASLELQASLFDYYQAALVDASGNVLLQVKGFQSDLAREAVDAVSTALDQRKAIMTDLHLLPDGTTPHVDVVAPVVRGDGSEPTAFVLLRAKAESYLYPLLTAWPVESNTAETLLVRRDGDQVLYLNELRHRSGTALKLRLPLSDPTLPAAAAVLGWNGITEGKDYRGVKVLAALQTVPETGWHVVAKVDASEALGPVKTRTWLLGALIAVLLVGCVGVVGFYRQRSLKKEYATAYEESLARHAVLERFQYLVQEAQDVILLADPMRRVIEANDRALEVYGYSREEFLKLRLDDIVPPETREDLHERLTLTREVGRTTHDLVGMRKDGSQFPIEVSDKSFVVDGQQLTQAIIRDISARKKSEQERLDLERQLQHSQRLESLGVLAGGIAHDFNNILTTILGNADLVLHEMPLSAPGRRGVQEVVGASRRAADLCQQMLAYSGRGRFIIEQVDLRALIEDMLNLLRSSIPKDTLLNLNLAKNLPCIQGDVSQINQVIMNLVTNAAEAIGDRSGVITISTGAQDCTTQYLQESQLAENIRPGLYVTLEVSDTGAGMDRETLSQIFEPFFTTKFTGRGLGLSAVLGIIRGHKGAIRVYSEPGKGTTFKVLLPAVGDVAQTDGEPADAEANWEGGDTVLVADDEETIRTLGKLMLERLGFNVLLAADGREAVEIFKHHADEIKLVILDLTMPHMNGEEAFRALKDLQPGVRVLLSSGYSESEIAARFAGKGPAGFIQKPYTLAALRAKVKQALS